MSKTLGRPVQLGPRDAARLWAKVIKTSTCWIFMGGISTDGYGRFRCRNIDGEQATITTHRAAAELAYGPAPAGLTHLHDCEVRICCRPAEGHLRIGTQVENVQQAIRRGRRTLLGDLTGGLGPVGLAHAIQDALRDSIGTPDQLTDVLADVLTGHQVPTGAGEALALFEL
jgi:hypothetical protein